VSGGLHIRWIDVRPGGSDDFPSIEQRFDEISAAGLARQDTFVQFTEAVRLKPAPANGSLRLDYLFGADQFRTSGVSGSSFLRWTADLRHEIPLYGRTASTGPRAFNGPDECGTSVTSPACPPVQWSRNREGTVSVRLLVSTTSAASGERVPFYLQQTLGGSDLNGERMLAGYDDYRFRGPNLLLLQEGIEHSLWGPVGAFVLAEHGRVARKASDLGVRDLAHSVTVGLTLRAGGFPMVTLAFGFGGEASHVIASMNPGLLGGSSRPSLY
jgi:hypothetical protein